jgi:hypothetical protein
MVVTYPLVFMTKEPVNVSLDQIGFYAVSVFDLQPWTSQLMDFEGQFSTVVLISISKLIVT